LNNPQAGPEELMNIDTGALKDSLDIPAATMQSQLDQFGLPGEGDELTDQL
jgi:hypothetical protein